jgi:hypothetical protein
MTIRRKAYGHEEKRTESCGESPFEQNTGSGQSKNSPRIGFCQPQTLARRYANFSKSDVFADSNVTASTAIQPIPKSWRQPEVLDLAQVLSAAELQQIQGLRSSFTPWAIPAASKSLPSSSP